MLYDEIAKAYLEEVNRKSADCLLNEMAIRINREGVNPLDSQSKIEHHENWLKRHSQSLDLGDGTVVHKLDGNSGSNYITTHAGKVVHTGMFQRANLPGIDRHLDRQTIVGQTESAPKGVARTVMLHHIERTGNPIVTDVEQTDSGHAMWKKLVPEAINRGLHVYHYHSGALSRIENPHDDRIGAYFGDDKEKNQSTHIIVSKEPLNGSN